jgi:hypothetical protein
MKVGVLTGGGDCPGLNAVIRAVVRKGVFHYGDEFVGFMEGWRGLLEDKTMQLDLSTVGGILPRGGTILRTSRTNPAKHADGLQRCADNLKKHGCDALVAIGGDDTLSVALKLHQKGVQVVGVPKTIENDLASIPPSTSPLPLSTVFTPPRKPTTASSSWKSWAVILAGSRCTAASVEARMSFSFPKSRSTLMKSRS